MSISFEPEEGYTVILPETEALQVHADKAREAIERDPGVRMSHLFPLVDATARFACVYMIAPQGCKPFELPRDPWLLVIGDDMSFAWGPRAFPSDALDAAIRAADQAVLITSGPDPYPYRVAATVAVRGRGAVALLAAVRSAQVLNKMSQEDATKAGVENHRSFFNVDNGKANLSPPPEGKDWFQIISIKLGNGSDLMPEGDSVGVVVPWRWPDPMEGVTGLDFEAAAQAIRNGRWRESNQAKDWVGKPIARALRLDLDSKADRAKVSGLVKFWLKAGSLQVVEELDEKRMARKYVQVADV